MKSNVDLYLNADQTKVVTEGPEAASLLVNAGREVPDAEIAALGDDILKQAQGLGSSGPVLDKAIPGPSRPNNRGQVVAHAAPQPETATPEPQAERQAPKVTTMGTVPAASAPATPASEPG